MLFVQKQNYSESSKLSFCIFASLSSSSSIMDGDSPLEWLQHNLTHQIAISCVDPELNHESTYAGTYKQAYLTYKIRCKDGSHEFDVRHRYNEFHDLRQELVSRYHRFGIMVPPLPAKNVLQINRFDDVFVKERMVGSNLFCEVSDFYFYLTKEVDG